MKIKTLILTLLLTSCGSHLSMTSLATYKVASLSVEKSANGKFELKIALHHPEDLDFCEVHVKYTDGVTESKETIKELNDDGNVFFSFELPSKYIPTENICIEWESEDTSQKKTGGFCFVETDNNENVEVELQEIKDQDVTLSADNTVDNFIIENGVLIKV